MGFQTVFKRYELKYMLTHEQKERLLAVMADFIQPDRYAHTTVRNIYLDTANYRLIRRSIEKPFYKEKIRIRSYAQATNDSTVFVELKKKYDHVVYKRRLTLPYHTAVDWMCNNAPCPHSTQIARELEYARSYYAPLQPTVYLAYNREAYTGVDDKTFRITFDDRILCRTDRLTLTSAPNGTALLPPDRVLMELKCTGGIPLWMSHWLASERLYKTSFSKYGTAYQTLIFPTLQEVSAYA